MTGRQYQPGQRVRLIEASLNYAGFGLGAGAAGAVQFTDGIGTVHIRWDNGQRIGVIEADVWLLTTAENGASTS